MMKWILQIFFILTVLCCNFVRVEVEIVNVFPLCSRKYPDIGECIMTALNKLRPQLASGKIGPGFTIEPLDPYILRNFELGDGRFLKVTLYDLHLSGATRFKLLGLRAYFEGNYLKFMPHIFIDKLHIKTKYSISGFLPLPLNGDLEFTLSNMEVHGNGRVKIYERNGVEYFNIEQAKLMFASIKPGNLKFSLPIGRPINSIVLNLIIRIIGDPVTKIGYRLFERQIDKVHLDVANDFIKDVPVSYFFSQ